MIENAKAVACDLMSQATDCQIIHLDLQKSPGALSGAKGALIHKSALNPSGGEVGRINNPVAATVQRDAVLRVGQQAAQLAGRGDAWDHQRDAAQGGGPQLKT